MSVGGTVVDVVKVTPHKWWINTLDGGRDVCAVYCDPQGEHIEVGDMLWWQGGSCYWTPRQRPDGRSDVKLPKLGYSGVSHPELPRCERCGFTVEWCASHGCQESSDAV